MKVKLVLLQVVILDGKVMDSKLNTIVYQGIHYFGVDIQHL